MHYKELLDMLDELQEGEIFYFKPAYPVFNAFHPEIKFRLFQISKGSEGYFRLKEMSALEEISVTAAKLENIFLEKNWHDYTRFDMTKDFNEWMNKAQ